MSGNLVLITVTLTEFINLKLSAHGIARDKYDYKIYFNTE